MNYIKIVSRRAGTFIELKATFEPTEVRIEAFFFFDEHDPASIGEAYAKAVAFKQRHLGCRLQTSVWRRCAGLPDLVEVGEPPRAMLRRVA